LKTEDIKTIAIIGSGFIGPGIAQVFASSGYSVWMMDIKPEMLTKARESLQANLLQMAEAGIIAPGETETTVQKVQFTTDMVQAVKPAQLVIEAVSENMGLKQNIFRQLDSLCPPEIILCTNTSVMSISEIASKSIHRERIVGTHFWNPPYLIPLVEVVKGQDTSDEILNLTYAVLKKAGKHPVKCLKDVPGFIANRLQHALWREAISIVENGIADAATVDEAIKNSFAVRLPVLGPLENADMVGLDLTFSIHDYILKHLEASPTPSKFLTDKIQRGELGFKSGQGFYHWTPAEIQQTRDKLSKFLINRLKEQPPES
jgi:3-hydroxybutyryl-CoA dehydrogenase